MFDFDVDIKDTFDRFLSALEIYLTYSNEQLEIEVQITGIINMIEEYQQNGILNNTKVLDLMLDYSEKVLSSYEDIKIGQLG